MGTIDEFKKGLDERVSEGISKVDIKYVNESPEAKATGIKIVRRNTDNIKTIFAVGFVVLVICASIVTYLAYYDKLNLVNLVCPAPDIPECPQSPDVTCPSLTCPNVQLNVTCAPVIKIQGNST